jgi:hypothetical protein
MESTYYDGCAAERPTTARSPKVALRAPVPYRVLKVRIPPTMLMPVRRPSAQAVPVDHREHGDVGVLLDKAAIVLAANCLGVDLFSILNVGDEPRLVLASVSTALFGGSQ